MAEQTLTENCKSLGRRYGCSYKTIFRVIQNKYGDDLQQDDMYLREYDLARAQRRRTDPGAQKKTINDIECPRKTQAEIKQDVVEQVRGSALCAQLAFVY